MAFGLARTSDTYLPMRLPSLWVLTNQRPFLCSMPSLAVTQYLHLQPEARRLHGIPGMHLTWQQRHSWLCQRLQKAFHRRSFPLWSTLQFSSMIAPAANSTSIKLVLSCSQRKEEEWSQSPQLRMHWCSTSKEQCTEGDIVGDKHLRWHQTMPSPTDWGWMDPSDWRPLWSTLPQASQSILELLSCGCKKGCRGHCKCKALCQCGGDCEGDSEE